MRGAAQGDSPWLNLLTPVRVSILIAVITAALYSAVSGMAVLRQAEGLLLDLRFQLRGVEQASPDLAIVHIGDESLQTYGRWPWSRSRIGDFVNRLSGAGARIVALDMLMLEPESSLSGTDAEAARDVLDLLETSRTAEALAQFRASLPDWASRSGADRHLASALDSADGSVIPFSLVFAAPEDADVTIGEQKGALLEPHAFRALRGQTEGMPLALHGIDALVPLPDLATAATGMGHVNVALEVDGTARYEYPVLGLGSSFYPSFALQIARLAMNLRPEEMRVEFGHGIQMGPVFIPTDESMRMLANFYGPAGTIQTYSYADVVGERIPAGAFDDKIVIVGVHGVGISDVFVTPFSAVIPGVERVATIVDNILTGRFLERRNAYWLFDVLFILVGCLFLGAIAERVSSMTFSLAALGTGGAIAAANHAVFVEADAWLNLTFPLFGLLLTYSSITIVTYLMQEQRERVTRRAFDHYLHPALVESLCENPDVLKLGGDRKTLTVLFSDVRNFSTISEGLDPQQLVGLMSEYFDAMTEKIVANQGLVDKYIGDAVMSVFGAPLPMAPEDQAFNACKTGLEMVESARVLGKDWEQRGHAALAIGVGVNTGEMVIGNMGSQTHFNYTVMGDEVNIGSRLEQLTKMFRAAVIISGQTRELVADRVGTRELDLVVVKGRSQPVAIYEVLGLEPLPESVSRMARIFESGLAAYRQRRWDDAIALFEESLELRPEDGPSSLFIGRCQMLKQRPPADDWNGVAPDRRVAAAPSTPAMEASPA